MNPPAPDLLSAADVRSAAADVVSASASGLGTALVPGFAPGVGVVVAALISAGIGAGVLVMVVGWRGTVQDPRRPPSRLQRWRAVVRGPGTTSRVAGAAVVGLGTLVVTRWPVAAAGLGVLVLAWPHLFGAARAEQAQIIRLEALVAWTESLRDTISGHASLEQAIPATTDTAPVVIRPALIRLSGRIRARAPLEQGLLALAAELDDASSDRVIAALILNVRRRGDRLAEVLTGLAASAREELDLRRRVSAGRSGMRRAVQIVVVLTLAFAAFLIAFGGTYLLPYSTPAGQVALAVVIGMFAAGFAWMRNLSGMQPTPPFLQRPERSISAKDLAVVSALTGPTTTGSLAGAAGGRPGAAGGPSSRLDRATSGSAAREGGRR